MKKDIAIDPEWKSELGEFFETEIFEELSLFVRNEYLSKKIFPEPKNLFRAFSLTPFSHVRVVVLG